MLKDSLDRDLVEQGDIEAEIVRFYSDFVGTSTTNMQKIDIEAMREGTQVKWEQSIMLTAEVTEQEVVASLKSIKDDTAPVVDGYGTEFYKDTWSIIRVDVMRAIRHFFSNGRMYKVANNTVVTIVPKTSAACRVKDFRPISFCVILYKLIFKL